jgi:hypothetical protein
MRAAHAGGLDEDVEALELPLPVMAPPLVATAARAPPWALSLKADAARRKGLVATPAPARATPPSPDAMPAAPVLPADPRL